MEQTKNRAPQGAASTDLVIRRVPIESLHQDPANARAHGEANMASIVASLKRFGQAEPLVVHKPTGRVIGGNGRLAAMKRMGWTECDVVELDIDGTQATALGIALNRTSELAEWDQDALAKILVQLQEDDALDGVGFFDDEIDELLSELEGDIDLEGLEDTEPVALPEDPVSRLGDVWILGGHRLLCGDSTAKASYKAVLNGCKADMVWTDPPYGVSYVGGTDDALTIQNDDFDGDELEAFLRGALKLAAGACKAGASWYVAAPAGPNFLPFAQVLTDLGVWRQTLVWVKDSLVLGRSDFHYRHEALFYGWTQGAAHHAPAERNHDTVWEIPRPKVSREHPTMKPLELVAHAIQVSSKKRATVLDPFGGSGTTLLAAEKMGRKAALIELDPRYCDVIVQRWMEATGEVAVLESNSQGFAEVGALRKTEDGQEAGG